MKKIILLFSIIILIYNFVFGNNFILISQNEDYQESNQQTIDEKNPKRRAAGHFSAGKRALQNDEIEKAYDQFKKAVSLNPKNAGYYYLLGVSALNLHKYDEAANAFQKAKKLDPNLGFTKDKRVFEERLMIAREKSGQRYEAQREEREQNREDQVKETKSSKTSPGTIIGIILLIIAGILLIYYFIQKRKKYYNS